MISEQKDISYINDIDKLNELILDLHNQHGVLKSNINKDDAIIIKQQFKQLLKDISGILTNRFGFKIKVNNLDMKEKKLSSLVMPLINHKTIQVAMSNTDKLFPKLKRDSILGSKPNINEDVVYNALKNITKSIKDNKLEVDLRNAKVNGLEDTLFIINIDYKTAIQVGTTAKELTSMLIYEVGRIFAYIEYMNTSNNSIHSLLHSFVNEKFNKDKSTIDSIKFAMKKVNPSYEANENSTMLLHDINDYMLDLYKIDETTGSVTIFYERTADIFVTKFGLATEISSLLTKRASNGIIGNDDLNSQIVTITKVIKIMIFSVISFVIAAVGMLILIPILLIKLVETLLKFIFIVIYDTIKKLFKDDEGIMPKFDSVLSRLHSITLELIHTLRQHADDIDVKNITEQINFIKSLGKEIKDNKGKLNKYGYDVGFIEPKSKSISLIEDLTANELHFQSANFSLLQKG